MERPLNLVVEIPVDGIVPDPDNGRACIALAGTLRRVAFDADRHAWRLLEGAPGAWRLGGFARKNADDRWQVDDNAVSQNAGRLGGAIERLELPPVPAVSAMAAEIPRLVHYIWLGENGLPQRLAGNILANAERSGDFQTVVHVLAPTAAGLDRVRQQLAPGDIEINDLARAPVFDRFMRSPLARFFSSFLASPTRNYGAASDMLRMYLLHAYGGIYMDCDDTIVAPFPAATAPRAAAGDLLVNAMISAPSADFNGYNQSNFGCHAWNPLLAEILAKMHTRLQSAGAFLSTPRPWRPESGGDPHQQAALDAYVVKILELTGPSIFSDVLRAQRPDYYDIEAALLRAYELTSYGPGEPRVVADAYMRALRAAKAHYLPFAEAPYEVVIGNADSWNIQDPLPEARS